MKTRTWCVWANAWHVGGATMTYTVEVEASTRNQGLKLGNKKLGIPRSKRDKLHIFERTQ